MISASGHSSGLRAKEYELHHIDLSVMLLDYALKTVLGMSCEATKAETLEGLAVAYAEVGYPARAATILRRV